ncbi:hypothetical protein B5S33_g3989 [[Candida] boidinii]|nr:hypothetical protein B5S33_g3989 [[Candida] boidinii]
MSFDSKYNSLEHINTLYIRNLNENVSKNKLREAITLLFNKIGISIRSITIYSNLQLKGQAFVTLSDRLECDKVISELNTTILFEKPMDIYLAKVNSDNGVKQIIESNSTNNSTNNDFENYLNSQKQKRLVNRNERLSKEPYLTSSKKRKALDSSSSTSNIDTSTSSSSVIIDSFNSNNTKKPKIIDSSTPNHILLLQNLPIAINSNDLYIIFDNFDGLRNINLVNIRNLAFIEFENEYLSSLCLQTLGKNFNIKNDHQVFLSFAMK